MCKTLKVVVIWLLVIYLVEEFYLVISGYCSWSKYITNANFEIGVLPGALVCNRVFRSLTPTASQIARNHILA